MYRQSIALAMVGLLASCGPPGKGSGTNVDRPTDGPLTPEQIFAASDLPPVMDAPLADDKLGVTIHRLQNGMTVYISSNREKPRFNAWIAVRAGSRHDPPDSTGLAHYLEHMMFKGTDKYGTRDFEKEKPHLDRIAELYDQLRATDDPARRQAIFADIDKETVASSQHSIANEFGTMYGKLGVTGINAFTWHDMTVYISDVPSNRLRAWARVEGERFQNPQFRLFYPELEAVYEEKNRSLDNIGRRIDYALHQAMFPKHPYGTQPTIGLVEHLKTPAYGDMVEFYKRWYVPNNMAIVLAGDIDAATALPVLEEAFGSWQPKALEAPAKAELPTLSGRSEIELLAKGENSVNMAWQTVGFNHPDMPALLVMDLLMANQKSGLIDVELVLSQKLPKAHSEPRFYREAGYFLMYGAAREGQSHAQVEALLNGVLGKLKRGEFSQEDIDAVVLQQEISEQRELESNTARVNKMAGAFWNHTPWSDAARRSARLRAVSKDDVVRVANQYLGDNFLVIKRTKGEHSPPKIDKPKITKIDIDPARKSAFAGSVAAMPATELEPEWLQAGTHYQRMTLPAGELLYAHNKVNDLFTVDYIFEVGRRKLPLLCFALDLLERSGTDQLSATALQQRLWRTGTDISFQCGVDELTVRVTGIERNLQDSLALLDSWLRSVKLTNESVLKFVSNRLSERKDELEEPRFINQALSQYGRLGKDSPALIVPSNAQLKNVKPAELAQLLGSLPDHKHKTLYFGPHTSAQVTQAVAWGQNHRPLKARGPTRFRRTSGETKIFFVHRDVAQSQISIVFPQPPMPAADRAMAEFLNQYLPRLIFQEIREARGLAYSAWAFYAASERPADDSALRGQIGTQSDKTVEALATMLELLRQLPEQPERFATTKQKLEQRFRSSRVEPRWITRWVHSWDEAGHASDPRPAWWQAIQGYQPSTLSDFVKRFAAGDVVIAIMGNRDRFDMNALKKLGQVEEVQVESLVGY